MIVGLSVLPLPAIDEKILRSTRPSSPIWKDRRRYLRYASDARCVAESDGTYAACELSHGSQEILLRDISRGGVRFLHGAEVYPGERFSIRIGRDRRLNLEVAWCRRLAVGVYVAGCRFLSSGDPGAASVADAVAQLEAAGTSTAPESRA